MRRYVTAAFVAGVAFMYALFYLLAFVGEIKRRRYLVRKIEQLNKIRDAFDRLNAGDTTGWKMYGGYAKTPPAELADKATVSCTMPIKPVF